MAAPSLVAVGLTTRGIENAHNGSMLTAESVTALGENGSVDNYGLGSYDGVTTTLRGGSFIARGGITIPMGSLMVAAARRWRPKTSLRWARMVAPQLWPAQLYTGATTLRGGSFTGLGGIDAYGICNSDSGTTLDAASITALGEGSSNFKFGLCNEPRHGQRDPERAGGRDRFGLKRGLFPHCHR